MSLLPLQMKIISIGRNKIDIGLGSNFFIGCMENSFQRIIEARGWRCYPAGMVIIGAFSTAPVSARVKRNNKNENMRLERKSRSSI